MNLASPASEPGKETFHNFPFSVIIFFNQEGQISFNQSP